MKGSNIVNIVLTIWAIIIGGMMLTPDGPVIIVENPAIRYLAFGVLLALGAISAFRRRQQVRAS